MKEAFRRFLHREQTAGAEALLDYLNMLADPDELTEDELAGIRQAKAEMERGEYVTLAELRRELGL